MYKNLVELVLENKRDNQIKINLSQSSGSILGNLFEGYPYGVMQSDVPVEIKKTSSWETHNDSQGEFLKNTFKFGTFKHMMYFINETLSIGNEIQHFPEILIKEMSVEVVLFTKEINEVTDIDIQLSKKISDIYSEIKLVYEN